MLTLEPTWNIIALSCLKFVRIYQVEFVQIHFFKVRNRAEIVTENYLKETKREITYNAKSVAPVFQVPLTHKMHYCEVGHRQCKFPGSLRTPQLRLKYVC